MIQGKPIVSVNFLFYVILGLMGALTPMALDMYLPAMPDIAKSLSMSEGNVQMTLSIYAAGFAIGQLVNGPISDSYGRKYLALAGIFLFALTSFFIAIANSSIELITLRFVQGFVGAIAAVIIQAIVRDLFDKEDFSRTMSFVTLVTIIAPLVSPVIGGYITIYFGWRTIFTTLVVVSALVMLLIAWKIPETLPMEYRQPLRLLAVLKNYYSLLTKRAVFSLILCSGFSFSGMFVFLTMGSFVYIDLYGVSAEHFGYLFALNIITMLVFTVINGQWVKKIGSENMLTIGLGVQLFGAGLLLLSWLAQLDIYWLVAGVMLFIGPLSLIGSNIMGLLLTHYPTLAGTVSALVGTVRFGMGALVGAIAAALPDGVLWPMPVVMSICALLSLSFYWLAGRSH